jgi:membrane protein DedA with SNARE-associated domain
VISTIGLLAGQNLFLAYFIIYVATIFLGNISAFVGFWIVFQGYFGVWGIPLLILTIFCADATGDLLWYSLGKGLRDTRLGNWLKNHVPGHTRIERALQKNGRNWIFLSKFIYASSFPVIFLVGWSKMGFKKFFRNSILSILVWLPILLGLAYGLISGLSPLRAVTSFRNFELVFFIGLGLFILIDYFLTKIFGKILERKAGLTGNGNGSGNGVDSGSGDGTV